MKYFPKIGLEIHIELKTNSKMFCSCPNDPEERHANLNICPICLGQPGTLPTINEEAIKKVIKVGLALNCQISEFSQFDRKNYFYPDLPKGYQISQFYYPLCKNGFLEIDERKIKIREIHLEEDTGSLVHFQKEGYSLVNFNRAGIPLMELATEPDITSAIEAKKFAQELHLLMHYLNVSDADMEKGQMRVEANISLSKERDKLGTKVEIKNLNSFKALQEAIEYEIKRQAEVLDRGGKIIQETRGWDENRKITVSQREKEYSSDYRYFPEPDLPPLKISTQLINEIKAQIPELPQEKRKRFKREYGLEEEAIGFFVYNKKLSQYFEKVISEFPPHLPPQKLSALIRLTSNYIISDLRGLLKKASIEEEEFLISPAHFAKFISLIEEGKISSRIAKKLLEEMFGTGKDPIKLIEEKNLLQITDEKEIEKIVKIVISENPRAVSDFKNKKESALQFLIGQVMARTKGRANPQVVSKILERILRS